MGHAWEGGIMKTPKKGYEALLKALLHFPELAIQDLWLEEQCERMSQLSIQNIKICFLA